MNWMDKLERKIGKYAIPNITRYLVIATLLGYLFSFIGVVDYLMFDPWFIMRGQVWRLVTWIFMPMPGQMFLGLIFLIFLLSWGNLLELCLGTFRTNVFVIGGLLFSLLGAFVVYGITALIPGVSALPVYLSSYYVLLTVIMAVSICMPDTQALFMFIFPMKMKWMLYITLIELGYDLFSYFYMGFSVENGSSVLEAVKHGLQTCWVFGGEIILALLNMAIFFYFVKKHIPWKQRKRKREFQKQFEPAKPRKGSGIYQHKCAVCGRTELDDPSLTFRYCSKCEGSYEYCNEHLYSHEHV